MSSEYAVIKVGESRSLQREFIDFPKRLYRNCGQWVPWFDIDVRALMRKKHPYFFHAEGDFFLVRKNGRTVARACVTENRRYNEAHDLNVAHFYFFDAEDDRQAVGSLIAELSRWSRTRGLDGILGPILQGGSSGSGILVEGFEYRAAMNMMAYNRPYYGSLLENAGFKPFLSLYSMDLPASEFSLPKKVARISELVLKRGHFEVLKFKSKRDVMKAGDEIAHLYNPTLGDHLEDYPLSEKELAQIKKDLLLVADPSLVKVLRYGDKLVGFLFAFPDLSDIMQKNKGKTGPLEILRLLMGMKKKDRVLFNGMGILSEYRKLGGNALLYGELEKTLKNAGCRSGEIVQISEKTNLMLKDVETLGGRIVKKHRMYLLKL